MDEKTERQLRRRAVRLHGAGHSLRAVGARLNRSRQWVAKWVRRFGKHGRPDLGSRSRRPRRQPTKTPAWVRRQVLRLRRKLERARMGLIGARAIQRAWRTECLPAPMPSTATIKRLLRAAGITGVQPTAPPAYFPAPRPTPTHALQAMDWTERYLEHGVKVYAFHTLDLDGRAAKQTISPNKTGATVGQHALDSWQSLGIPAFLQLDNDAAFNGGYKAPRVIGQFVRLCLCVGVELIFLPVREAERNGAIESFNHLWSQAFYDRQHFGSFAAVKASRDQFENWYRHDYDPPKLNGQTPAQVAGRVRPGHRLTDAARRSLPSPLPITAGRVHFIRPVSAEGAITLLNETWRVGQRLAGQYVWATIRTHRHTLSIYHRRAASKPMRLVRVYPYPLPEAVQPLSPPFQTGRRRCKVSTMS